VENPLIVAPRLSVATVFSTAAGSSALVIFFRAAWTIPIIAMLTF
jgi:hypothetical protein